MFERHRATLKYDAALLCVVLIWGINFPFLKAALGAMHPHVVNALRFTVSAGVLGGLYAARARTWSEGFLAPLRTHAKQIALLGLLGYGVNQVSFIVGMNNTSAGSAALIMAAAPLWTALLSRIAGYERLGKLAWLGLGTSLIGTALVIATGVQDAGVGGSLFGHLVMLLSSVLWGAYTAFNKTVVHDVSPIGATFFGLLVALPLLIGVGAPHFGAVQWARVDVWVWGAIVFSGGLATGLAFAIWNTAVKHVGASNTAAYNNLVPFLALVGGALFLSETVTWTQVGGGALIISGLVIMRRDRRRGREVARRVVPEGTSAVHRHDA